MIPPVKPLLCSIAALALAGCSVLDIGSSDYGCPGMPNGVQCRSARDVYEATNNRNALSSTDSGDEAKDDAAAPARALTGPAADAKPVDIPVVYSDDGKIPVRTQAVVMRVWIAPYEDHNGDLHMGGFLYTEVESRKWQIGSADASYASAETLRPLDATPAAARAPVQAVPANPRQPHRQRTPSPDENHVSK